MFWGFQLSDNVSGLQIPRQISNTDCETVIKRLDCHDWCRLSCEFTFREKCVLIFTKTVALRDRFWR